MDWLEKRRYPRDEVFMAVIISPNGHEHRAAVFDLSESGARLGLPSDWEARPGTGLRLFFLLDDQQVIALSGQVTRVAIDHMGVQFCSVQGEMVRKLLDEAKRLR